jgi:predicted dehydrogenase
MASQFDAVTVSTPDHTHAAASVMAMKHGKHVYCQKPLTHTVYEARQMREVAKKAGVCSQMGNQGSAENGLRRAVEVVQAGIIGPVREAHVWTNRPIWPQAPKVMKRPDRTDPVPANLHWDEWLGPAPFRPYVGNRTYHDFAWRGWWDFGTGALGDMACHTANMAYRALKLGYPTGVVADATDVNPETYPSSAHVTYEFPARGDLPAVAFTWYEGKRGGKKLSPPEELLSKVLKKGEKLADSGSMLVGDKGILFSPNDYGAKYILVGEGLEEAAKKVPQTLPRNGKGDTGMKQEWVEAIKAGKADHAYSNFDIAGMLTESILLGNIAIKLNGQKLAWDGPALQFTNNSTANSYVHYEYRKGWTL